MSESTPDDQVTAAMDGSEMDPRGLPEGYPLNAAWEVTPAGLAGAFGGVRGADASKADEQPLLLDVRNPDEVAASRIHDDATVIRLQELEARVDELTDSKERKIIVHCRLGQRSLRAASFLRSKGYNAWSMAGGIEAYERAFGGTHRQR